jgi:outer membrane lipoprotein-sorting protein
MKAGGWRLVSLGFLLLLGILLLGIRAEAGDLEEFLDRVEDNAARIDSFSCDFRQERNLALFSHTVIFTGRLYLARPDRLRWEFVKPIPSLLILDGNTGRRCGEGNPASEFRLDRDPAMRLVAEQLRTWASGDYRRLQGDFTLELEVGPALRLTPRQAGLASFLNRIVVTFDQVTLQPTRVEIIEEGGDNTVISFGSYLLNPSLPAELFSECRITP